MPTPSRLLARRSARLLGAGLLLAALACSGESTGLSGGPTPSVATYRIANGTPYAVTVLRDGAIVARDIPSGEYTNPLPIATAGPVQLVLRRTGGAADVPLTFTAREGFIHTVAATATAGQPITARVLTDAGSTPQAARGKLRLVNLAAEAPAVDFWYEAPSDDEPTRVTPSPLPLGAETPYLLDIPGAWRVWVTPAGQAAPVLAEANAVLLGSGTVRTVALLPGGEGVVLRTFDDR